ncbi:hypothetical protein TPHA_0G00560 [Tetrapisispora phaffii CBS 4417]|uniref:Ubiquitin carboxyl-terminal hydrolase n=1 Tax=Tetrapisispora phaffii (strain ATCC 24235 / CBS 4417 / NBRC 1672 / NRRL Y-8282 / UCD 70-5) TaxID=1071381 RepID=G8BVG4_TETPH|nr:hypothetical protein TPHA_0G00560 [Tetrapisispora phaffii CBS 4417]CCE63892.1 hypothetical protein TPHA_0G00560 [Tetrapisispora phaffii CBS 4417]
MSSCQHINHVLSNPNSRDGVLKACNATKYILMHSDAKDKYLNIKKCSDCHNIDNGSTFMCLQCGYCGCWNSVHFIAHHKKVGHIFGINSSNGLLYCFICDDYVGDSEEINFSIVGKNWNYIAENTSFPSYDRKDGLSGLVNMGSTCYMSCIIQCLVRNPYFLKHSFNQTHYKECKIRDPVSCLSCALDSVVFELYGKTQKKAVDDKNGGLIDILNCTWKINEDLVGYSQQDAHEFWQFLMNRIHSEYKLNNNTIEVPKDTHQLCNCIYHKVFQGFLESTIECANCRKESKTTTEAYMDLSLDLKDKKTLYECLNSFHMKEELKDFTFHCSNCGGPQGALKQLTISKLPPVLLLQLKRFEHKLNGQSSKLNDSIEYPPYLRMNDYCQTSSNETIDSPDDSDIIYELIGVICHTGTVNEGHYICSCKLANNQWVKFNDSMITIVDNETVLKEQAYLLIYSTKQVT